MNNDKLQGTFQLDRSRNATVQVFEHLRAMNWRITSTCPPRRSAMR
ncbi:hypothetical protein [Massilia violaceinigra]|nr:hypothetical protein [Massilia violaceinigra]